jgi:hypothetical protein
MLTYTISGSNEYSIRTYPSSSNEWTMSLQDMTLLTNSTASLSGITYNGYESILNFTASIGTRIVAEQYRATIINSGSGVVWHGTINTFTSQSIDKVNYVNQIPLDGNEVSHESENKYIILE